MGADASISFKPQVRITGVFKGADVLQSLLDSKQYILLPTVDVYLGMELGILNLDFMEQMRAQLPEAEFIRQFLCRNLASQNHIWERHIRKAKAVGLAAGLSIADALPGERYRRRGLITFGYDHLGHGESLNASKSALVVSEQIGNFVTFPFVRTWPAGTDDRVIENDLLGYWAYFMPDYACGDAYGIGMLTTLNDRLYANNLTHIDRRTFGDGQSTASTWVEWPFAPIRFEGMVKHSMACALRAVFHNGQSALPYFDEFDTTNYGEWISFVRQLGNIQK
jgi:hypothetical protein